jgi:hypothetical protein
MSSIDIFIKEAQMKNNINNYIETGKLPDNYYNDIMNIMNTRYHYIKEKSENNKIVNNLYDNLYNNINMEPRSKQILDEVKLKNSINTCCEVENILKKIIDNKDACPICLENIDDNNYVKTKCEHRLCVSCFASNIKKNQFTHDLCPLCRERIF